MRESMEEIIKIVENGICVDIEQLKKLSSMNGNQDVCIRMNIARVIVGNYYIDLY
jgi:hypothetical protein